MTHSLSPRLLPLLQISLLAGLLSLVSKSSAQTFTEVTSAIGIHHAATSPFEMGGGVAVFDYDGDGDEDLYFTGGDDPDQLYANDGTGNFTDVSLSAGFRTTTDATQSMSVMTADLDNDGFRDLFIGTLFRQPNYLFKNNGNGTFTDITVSSGFIDSTWSHGVAFGDYDLDGYLDMYFTSYVYQGGITYDSAGVVNGYDHTCYTNRLYHNNGNFTFTEVTNAYQVQDTGCALAVVFTDFDGDRDVDLYLANDFGEFVVPNKFWRNDYPAGPPWPEISTAIGADQEMYSMGIAVGDYDHDLDLDYYVTNIGRNLLLQNDGTGNFTDQTTQAGVENTFVRPGEFVTSWATEFMDYDNDTWDDLFVANGRIITFPFNQTGDYDPDKLYRNNGDGTFSDVGLSLGFADTNRTRGAGVLDMDGDGDLDIVLGIIQRFVSFEDSAKVFRNDASGTNHWLRVQVQGTVNNRDGYGTRLQVFVGGDSWIREVSGLGTHSSQNSSIAHFGLGTQTTVDSLWVFWPGSSGVQVLTGIPADTTILVVEDTMTFVSRVQPSPAQPFTLSAFPNPFEGKVNLAWNRDASQPAMLQLRDALGRVVANEQFLARTLPSGKWTWQLSDLPPGVYMTSLQEGNRQATLRLVVQ